MPTTTPTTRFTAAATREIGAAINEALAKVASDFGINIANAKCSYNANSIMCKVGVTLASTDGTPNDPDALAFKEYSWEHGIDVAKLGHTFRINGKNVQLIGYAPRSRKYPVLCKNMLSGKVFKHTLAGVLAALQMDAINYPSK